MSEKEFISKLSHDIKNPMAAIKLLSEILIEGKVGTLTEKQKELILNIKEANDKIISLLEAARRASTKP